MYGNVKNEVNSKNIPIPNNSIKYFHDPVTAVISYYLFYRFWAWLLTVSLIFVIYLVNSPEFSSSIIKIKNLFIFIKIN